MRKFKLQKRQTVISIFKKKKKKAFCKIEIDDAEDFNDIYELLNSPARYIKLGDNIIIDKIEIDYIILEESFV